MIVKNIKKAGYLLLTSFLFCITVKGQLVAGFSSTQSQASGCAPVIIKFIDKTTGNPTKWFWNLGNGTISFLQNPSVTYFNPGNYTVKLVVKNATEQDSVTKMAYVQVKALPIAKFTSNINGGCFPLKVQFTDTSVKNAPSIKSWQWDFGDGILSTNQNPSHIYSQSGSYNVALQIVNSNGCTSVITKSNYISISSGALANFSESIPNVCTAPLTVNFKNLSTGTGALTYNWTFGDGIGTSTLTNPIYTYAGYGSYTVTLITKNTSGCTDTIIKKNEVVLAPKKTAFTAPDSACSGVLINFVNNSTPQPDSVNWNFGDGTQSIVFYPSKSFSTPGKYVVKMIAYFGGCNDSYSKNIVIIATPKVDFIADSTSKCTPPLKVTFTNNSTNGTSFLWDFGDGTTSTAQSTTHIYTTSDSYPVKLTVSNNFGCKDSLIKTSYIKIIPPKVVFNNLPDSGCAPFIKTFITTVTTVDPIISYAWDFGDGTTSKAISPTHTYNIIGTYPVKLVITTAGGCTYTAISKVIVVKKPTANFNATPTDVCAFLPVQFNDLSTGGPTSWFWNFSDGTSTLQNPIHIFSDTGVFTITLIVSKGSCPDTIIFPNYIHIKPPIARFLVAFNCASPFDRTFTDQSIGADTWNWDFGDGTTSTLQNPPLHTFPSEGTYAVGLIVHNNSTGCDYPKKQDVVVVNVIAAFKTTDLVICKNNFANFTTGINAANVNTFHWDFGDGTVVDATINTIKHLYTQAGTYNVTLTVTDILNCVTTLTKNLYIKVNGPTANFSTSSGGSCISSKIVFTDNSVSDGRNLIQIWQWNYGDGIIETLSGPPFQHIYTASGNYIIQLKVIDNVGCIDSFMMPAAFIISKPVAAFISADTLTCPGQTINFTNQSTDPNLTYNWDFGNGLGSTSTAQNPTYIYNNNGYYTIKLAITDQYGCTDSVTKPNYIAIKSSIAKFTMSDSTANCPPLIVAFTDLSTNELYKSWDFGDGNTASINNPSHFYSYPGTYIVTLTTTTNGGCKSTAQRKIVVNGPTGTFTYTPLFGCVPATVNFVGQSQPNTTLNWDFNDGNVEGSAGKTISHTYTYPGFYVPKMIVTNAAGCQVPIIGLDTITINQVVTNFNFLNKTLCDSGIVSFTDLTTSTDLITSYKWNFGDGISSTDINPVHDYTGSGLFYPEEIVTTQRNCIDTFKAATPVKIVVSPKIAIGATTNDCSPLKESFTSKILLVDTSAITWKWNFDNGNTSTLATTLPETFLYTNNNLGIYKITLVATNSSGCTHKDTAIITAYPIPVVKAGNDTFVCSGIGKKLYPTGAATYVWNAIGSPPDNPRWLSCSACKNPIANPLIATYYIVKGSTIHHCFSSDTLLVNVIYPFSLYTQTLDTMCIGQSVKLSASGTATYIWTPASSLDNSTIANPIASPTATTTYTVIGTDAQGCFHDTTKITVKVFPIPVVNAGPDMTINVGQTATIAATVSSDVTNINWTPTYGIVSNNYPGIIVKPDETTVYTIAVTNPAGCKASDDVKIFVVCNGNNIFVPNTFSPNGDGVNDIFYPRGTGLAQIKSLRIFDRWGEIVFEKQNFTANDATAGWDGKLNGVQLTPDVYVYTMNVLCENNTILVMKGNVALIK